MRLGNEKCMFNACGMALICNIVNLYCLFSLSGASKTYRLCQKVRYTMLQSIIEGYQGQIPSLLGKT